MQVTFMRWCVDPKGRNPVSVDPTRVDCTEFFSDEWAGSDVAEAMPAATKIIMKGKQEYLVQGDLDWVVRRLNQ